MFNIEYAAWIAADAILSCLDKARLVQLTASG
jgi:hypothetical protein